MSRSPPTSHAVAPFVGREVELELLKEAHASARTADPGSKRLVLVTGGAGVGKSMLLSEFARYLRGRNERWLEGRCYAGVEQAYQPFAEIVTQALASAETFGADGAVLTRFVSRLEPLLPARRSPGAIASKWQMYDALLEFLLELGRIAPHALFVHDLHFADPASLDLLRFLAENLCADHTVDQGGSDFAGLLVVSSREGPEGPGAVLRDLRRLPSCTEIRLGGLGKADVAKLLQTSPIVEHLYERSGGNPHHLEELLLSLPSEVEDLFLQRARRVSANARACLGALAVLGRPADVSLVAQTAGLAEADVVPALRDLVAERMVAQALSGGRVRFAFAKEIHQEHFYRSLGLEERRALHGRAGEALAAAGEAPELLAMHFLRAGDDPRGPRFAREAARTLAGAHAYDEAAELLSQATAWLDGEALAEALSELADLHQMQGQYGKALHALGRLYKVLPPGERAAPLRRAGRILTLKGSYGGARRLLERALKIAEGRRDLSEKAEIGAALAEVRYLRGEYAEAEALCNRALAEVPKAGAPVRIALANIIGKIHLQLERFDDALQSFEANLRLAREAGLRGEEAAAQNNLGIVWMRRGAYDQAEAAYREALAIFEELHDPSGRAFCQQNLGVLFHERADYTRALEAYHRGLAGFRRVGNKTQLTNTAINLGNLYLSLGDLPRAERLISFALDVAGELSMPLLSAYGYNLLGETLCAQERWDAARVYLDRAQALFDKVGSRRLIAEVRLNLARLWQATGKPDKADAALRKVEAAAFAERMPRVSGQACLLRGDLFFAAGELDRAQEFYEWARELFVTDGDEEGTWRAHHGLGRVAARQARTVEAENHYLKARALIDALASRVPEDLRDTYRGEPRRRAVFEELSALGRDERLPARARREEPAIRRAEPLFRAAATDLTQVRREFSGRRPGGAYEGIIGQSPKLNAVLRMVEKLAPSSSTVLLRGESGTGKELIAEAIHRTSPRRNKPFIKVNCAAFVETLLLSELFGHEKGAFTGAVARKRGRFELADGGTLFLDEIGDISPKTQVALLRVLQEKQFDRVGGVTPVNVDVRIVCATNRDLDAMVRAGEFREDLYFRLKGIVVELPPLRERREDIPLLATHFLEKVCQAEGLAPMLFDEEAMELLIGYPWPGNIRELENVVRSAVLLAEGRVIGKADLLALRELREAAPASEPANSAAAPPEDAVIERVLREEIGLAEMKKHLELECIRRALKRTGGNITQAAKLLQMKRPRLSQIVKEYGDLLKVDKVG
jgi:DNA-binding NtrC family response regulator/Flp pilus assembly protein TadD